jgi:uncharacterized protein YndB with AHSA1/START domain
VTDDSTRTDRLVDLTIDIGATLEDVWEALTTGEGIARWFAPHATVTPGDGGSVSVGWDANEMWTQPITVWQPLSARFRTTARAGEDHPVFGTNGLRVQPPVNGLRPGDACRLSLGGAEVEATVAVRHASRTIAFLVPAWHDALLFMEREGTKEAHQLGIWLSLYGVPENTAAPLRQGLAGLQAALAVAGG